MSEELNNENEYQSNESPVDENGEAIGDGSFVTEEKKPVNRTTLVMFTIIALGGAGLYFMHLKTGPKSALAANTEAAQAKQTITQFLSGGESNLKLMEQTLQNTEKVVQQFLTYPSVTQVPLTDLKTNPFRQTLAHKTDDQTEAEAKKKNEAERLAALKSVQGLQLQSVMYSPNAGACMVNNTLYKEGQQVSGFTIEKINKDSVVVKSGVYRFELTMQR